MRTRIQRWGNSLALRIPRLLAQEAQIGLQSVVDLQLVDERLVISPVRDSEYSLDDLLSAVMEENLHGEVGTGSAVGREAW